MYEKPAWAGASRITERLATLPHDMPPLLAEEKESARRRLAAWKGQVPFGQDEWFQRRLLQDGLTQDTFFHLVGFGDDSLEPGVRFSPEWQVCIEQAFAPRDHSALPMPPIRFGAFTLLVLPLVQDRLAKIRGIAEELRHRFPSAPFNPETVASLLWVGMEDRLDWMLSRSVVLDLHIARLQGTLPGETPQERFHNFIATLSSPPRALAFLQEYPVLARALVETLDLWEEASSELLSRLCHDWEDILAAFHPEVDPGPLESLAGGVGDLHCRGRSVRILSFRSGFRISYKPRPVAVNARFAELLSWLNQRGAPGLAAARVIEREGYGWMEFITPRPCSDRGELERFYQRQGAFLALFHVLNATDLHRENLIASGEHPIFIDLECLLGPDYGQFDPKNYDSLAHFEMDHSVMRVMILPFFFENQKDVVDPSGLGGDAAQISVHEIPLWEKPETDEMRLTKGRTPVPPAQNRPTLEGRDVNPLDFRQQLEEGFTLAYRLLVRHRQELLAEGSPLSRFSDAEVRIVFRASQLYSFILTESLHPDLLRNAVDRDRHFDRLWFGIDRSKLSAIALRLLPIEREDLWRGDIPYFCTRADSRDVWGSCGQPLPELLVHSGLELVKGRLRQMGEKDLDKQLWYIKASLTALAMELQTSPPPLVKTGRAAPTPGRDGLLGAAAAISQRLLDLALRGDGQAAWLGLARTRARGWWLRPLDADLYSGLPGLALYLAHSGAILEQPEHTLVAREALANLDRQLERRNRVTTVGGFDGWGGIIYTWLHLGRLWKDDSFVQRSLDTLPKLAELIDQDEDLDIVRGSAGGIVPLLALHRESGSGKALDLARQMGDRIVAAAKPFHESVYWRTASFPVHPLTGFSHGNSGFAWALLELFGATGDERYRTTAARALAFEAEFFSEEEQNWMDLRSAHGDLGSLDYTRFPDFNVAWCHGACGIGLSRLRMRRHLDTPEMLKDARIAGEKILQQGFGVNHSLCHGDLGNLELILEVSQASEDPYWRQAAETQTRKTLSSIEHGGCLCGVPYFVETPGLMDGLAGIGYGLLRLAEPNRVPSVLLLDLPIPRAGAPG